jgi:hypothetical protein
VTPVLGGGGPRHAADLDARTVALLVETSSAAVLEDLARDRRPAYERPGALRWNQRVCAATDCWQRLRLPIRYARQRYCSRECRDRDRMRRRRGGRVVPRVAARRAAIRAVVDRRRDTAA